MIVHGLTEILKNNGAEWVDLWIVDGEGELHTFAYPKREFNEGINSGFGFDGSSLRGFQLTEKSDMLLKPSPTGRAFLDPLDPSTIKVFSQIYDPWNRGEPYVYDSSHIAHRLDEYLEKEGLNANVGAELEFFVLNGINYHNNGNYTIHADEDPDYLTDDPTNVFRMRRKGAYSPDGPQNKIWIMTKSIAKGFQNAGLTVEGINHEVAPNQIEIDVRYDTPLQTAFNLLIQKFVAKMIGQQNGKVITYIPKLNPVDNGSGNHIHLSIFKNGKNLFFDSKNDKFGYLSEYALHGWGGVKQHIGALAAFANPLTISYKRLVPEYEAPTQVYFARGDRHALARIPFYFPEKGDHTRIEFRFPDPSANPFELLPALVLAFLDGVENKADYGMPLNLEDFKSIEDFKVQRQNQPSLPRTLGEAYTALEKDNKFLTKNGIFTNEYIMRRVERALEVERKLKKEIGDDLYNPKTITPEELKMYINV